VSVGLTTLFECHAQNAGSIAGRGICGKSVESGPFGKTQSDAIGAKAVGVIAFFVAVIKTSILSAACGEGAHRICRLRFLDELSFHG
jgi:hypothetical protein